MRTFCVGCPSLRRLKVFLQPLWKGIRATFRTGRVVSRAAARALWIISDIPWYATPSSRVIESLNSGLRKPDVSTQSARKASYWKPQNWSSMLPVVACSKRGQKFRGLQNLSAFRWNRSLMIFRRAGGVHQKFRKFTCDPVERVVPSVSLDRRACSSEWKADGGRDGCRARKRSHRWVNPMMGIVNLGREGSPDGCVTTTKRERSALCLDFFGLSVRLSGSGCVLANSSLSFLVNGLSRRNLLMSIVPSVLR